MTHRRSAAALLAGALVACVTTAPAPTVDGAGAPPPDPEARATWLRTRIAAAPDDLQRSFLRDDLARVEFERARQAHTVFAYKRFLDEFPAGEQATAANALLEGLRFDEAARAGTAEAWQTFLSEHPRGRRVADARERLGDLEIGTCLAGRDLTVVRRVLARYPDHPRRVALAAHEDQLTWDAARTAAETALASTDPIPTTVLDELDRYQLGHPQGRFRADATDLRSRLDARRLLESDDLEGARRRSLSGDATPAILDVTARLELAHALADLDLDALRLLSTSRIPSVANAANTRLDSLTRIPLSAEVQAALALAKPAGSLRPPDVLRETIASADPVERVAAVRELVEWSRAADVGALAALADARWVGVALDAIDGLVTLAKRLPAPVVRARLADEETRLLGLPLDAAIWRRIAAIREALGRPEDAIAAWREVLRDVPDELVGRVRVLRLELAAGDRLSANAAARDLARAATSFGDARELSAQDRDLPPEARRDGPGEVVGTPAAVSVLRQLCTAIDLVDEASKSLTAARIEAGAAENELLGIATADADRALDRLRRRRREMEQEAKRRDPAFVGCESDPAKSRLVESRRVRVEALGRLASAADARVLEAVRALVPTVSEEVRAAATATVDVLLKAPPEPPAPTPVVPETPAKSGKSKRAAKPKKGR